MNTTDAHRLYRLRRNPPAYDYSNEGGMRHADGQGYLLHGSTEYEIWAIPGSPLLDIPTDGRRLSMVGLDDEGELLETIKPSWLDHQRIERDGGETRFVCHPYHLNTEAFRDFLTLEAAGWCVWVSGESIYYPGKAVRVEIWRENAA
ncbi:hypothetical protein FXW78_07070 [Rhodococcus opacus]|nr:hypothetical protein [Rhodococcus opacus]